jgi:NAD(P)-dependent dehydrogenase (short-subunit alcohol dehydrogenase family)
MKIALITGCNGGIGRELCKGFKSKNYKVIGIDLSDPINNLCDDFIKLDLSDPDWSLLPKYSVDLLINNAAIQVVDNFFDLSDEQIDNVMNVNIINIIKLIKRLNFNKDSNIINIGSIHSTQSKPGFSIYATSKGALETLTRSLSVELAPNIRVNMIKPAAIKTKMLESGLSKKELEKLYKYHPTKRIGEGNNIFKLSLSIIDNYFLNGSIISIDGGISNVLHDPEF